MNWNQLTKRQKVRIDLFVCLGFMAYQPSRVVEWKGANSATEGVSYIQKSKIQNR